MAKANGNMWELRNEQTTSLGCVDNRCGVLRIVLGCGESFCLWSAVMKYEITKGSEKDFEGGLSGCTHVYDAGAGRIWCSGEHSVLGSFRLIAERQPISEPVWSGDGLPPVGIECEIKRVADWFPVTIKFISGYYTVILTRAGTEDAYQTSALQFRPIRSPEDVAKDEAIESMAEIIEYRTGCSPKPLARWLYEAGYRKME